MRKLLLTATALVALATVAKADVIYTIDTTNDFGTSGAGPYAQVDIHLVDPTHATATFSRLGSFVFGEMGLDINAATFGITGLTFTLAATSSQTPTYTIVMGGKVGGIGNFALDYAANPNGFTDAVTQASFTITNTSGTWANQSSVLTASVPEAAVHAFNSVGGSFFGSGGPCTGCDGGPPPPPPPPVPEPMTLAILCTGLLGLAVVRRRREQDQ